MVVVTAPRTCRGSTMTDVIHLRLGAAGPVWRDLAPTAPQDRFTGRLLGVIADAIRRGLVARELRRLDDHLLRDIGLDREEVDLAGWAGPSRATVAWDAGSGTGSHLLGAPGP
jgi:uncharacterized protein YjiS (DUF1127 family)